MTSGRKTKAQRSLQQARASVVTKKSTPWGTIIAVVAVLALAGTVFGYAYSQISARNEREAALAKWKPSDTNKDPSDQIAGVVKKEYPSGKHVSATQRVAYDQSPPFGGPHDNAWAACTGVVYPNPVRTENMVHSLEHGAIWIAYNPDQVTGDALTKLAGKVNGQQYMMMSPYPGLDKPVSLQSWGHQLKLDSVDDERIDQFIQSLRTNQYTYPEIGASCDALGPGQFDPDNPPAFVAEPPGADAVPMDGGETATDEQQQQMGNPQTGTTGAVTSGSNPPASGSTENSGTQGSGTQNSGTQGSGTQSSGTQNGG
ncbi:DUF3105 domain-containing protein [Goodfellowiella coeruleoviolacea]|uniref:DUF3105 domain-containing protein n=1 Tax=Goodfellowiella coeruleoviolacea TaxID=334858 RepID=A0AAE3GEV2_9PSEU|nr:DUF3105 domain-containing protein [Goodfellowiella coeruleoviolacea]MCP2166921.1 Protein of unknown function (DUF3105) [Goodfellowiella coeruleoviolacea]